MKKQWLYCLLRENILVDNQVSEAREGVFSNNRLEPTQLAERAHKGRRYPWNDSGAIWRFLNTTSRRINQAVADGKSNSLVLFGGKAYEHNTDAPFIKVSGVDSRNFRLETNNLIGFVKQGDYALKISSRFGDPFLKHIIATADGFLPAKEQGGKDEKPKEGYEWLLRYLWKIKLQKAYRLGIPKQYVSHKDRLNRVRGQIDPIAYFSNSQDGKYLCQYREHGYDNPATQLIAAAFRKQEQNPLWGDLHNLKQSFVSATKGRRVPLTQLYQTSHFSNPYYQEYNEVIDLSKMILRDEFSDFGANNQEDAFLFDVSMLFEYFIRKLLIRSGFHLEPKFSAPIRIPSGTRNSYKRKLEPDLLLHTPKGSYVFDVKYKSYDFRYGVKREDLFQLHTYMGQCGNSNNFKGGGFIYPLSEKKWKEVKALWKEPVFSETMQMMGKSVTFSVLFLIVPDEKGKDFHKKMRENSNKLVERMKVFFD